MANETWKFVQAKSKQAMKQVLGIRDEKARMKVPPPLAVAILAHGHDMRWKPNDDGISCNPERLHAASGAAQRPSSTVPSLTQKEQPSPRHKLARSIPHTVKANCAISPHLRRGDRLSRV